MKILFMGAVASKWVKMSYFIYRRKVTFRVWLITCENIISLWPGEPPKLGVCMYYRYSKVHFAKIMRAFFSALSFSKKRFIKKKRAQSVFMLQRWLANENIAERIMNKNSALDCSFTALFICNIGLNRKIFEKKKLDLSMFL